MKLLKYGMRMENVYRQLFTTILQTKSLQTTATTTQDEVLFEKIGTTGVITFNRPKEFNILHYRVVAQMFPILQSWERSQSRVIIKGAGDTYSASGDLKWLLSFDRNPNKKASVATQANNVYLVSKYRIPCIALLDGIAFGGTLMVAANGQYRVATERTLVAMPEARIGWLPDMGAPYLLPRLDNHLGFYMGLTGKRLKGKDVVLSGIATHFVPSDRLRELESDLCRCNTEDIEARLDAFSEPLGEFSLSPIMGDVDYCFSGDTVEEIIERLMKLDNAWSRETLEALAPMCPTLLKVTLRALQLGRECDLKNTLGFEHRVLCRCIGSYNAFEGLRSLLLEKTDRPKWKPLSLAEVTDEMVDSFFDPLPEGEELKFYDDYYDKHV